MILLHILKNTGSFLEDPLELLKQFFLNFSLSPNELWLSALCFAVGIPAFGYLVFVGSKSSPFSFYSFSWLHITASQFVMCGLYMNVVWLTMYFYSPSSWSRGDKPYWATGFISTICFTFLYLGSYALMLLGEADSTIWNYGYYTFQFCGLATLFSNARGLFAWDKYWAITWLTEILVWSIMKTLVVVCYVCGYFGLVLGFIMDMANGTRILIDFNMGCWGIFLDFILIDIVILRILNKYTSFKDLGMMEIFKLIFVPAVMLCDVLQLHISANGFNGPPKKKQLKKLA